MRIAMIGTGYVGLVSGACMAGFGHDVVCVDKDEAKIELLERGEIPIHEPELQDIVCASRKEGRLAFTTELAEAVAAADAVFIAVGTPSRVATATRILVMSIKCPERLPRQSTGRGLLWS
jgi:UDPglucose 6-dehydrogenase